MEANTHLLLGKADAGRFKAYGAIKKGIEDAQTFSRMLATRTLALVISLYWRLLLAWLPWLFVSHS
jgi:hypothetical protein